MASSELALVLAGLTALWFVLMLGVVGRQYRRIGPNEALVVVGGRRGLRVARGGTFVFPVIEQAEVLDLSVRLLQLHPPPIHGPRGAFSVDVLVQYGIEPTEQAIRRAAERFLKRAPQEIDQVALQVLEAHVRSALADQLIQDVQLDMERAADKIRVSAREDLDRLGLVLHAVTVEDVRAA